MAPPPPPWLMMAICWPRVCESFSAAIRAVTSMPPPGGNGTYILIGRDGKSACAWATAPQAARMAASNAAPCSSFLIAITFVCRCRSGRPATSIPEALSSHKLAPPNGLHAAGARPARLLRPVGQCHSRKAPAAGIKKMQRSTERILTTHVGSLPRPDDLFDLMLARMDGNAIDEKAYAERVRGAVKDCVRQQIDAGLDVVNDGEMGKPSFITYAASRLSGLEKREGFRPSPFANTRETADFPDYYRSAIAEQVSSRRRRALVACTGPVAYKGHAALKADLETLKAALAGAGATEAFVPAIAPSNVEATTPNEYYPTPEAYVFAIAEAMREEYRAIVDAGFLLQIDDPFLVTYYITRPDLD